MPQYPAIPDVGATFEATQPAIVAIRETLEIITGARDRSPTGQTQPELDARITSLETRLASLEARVTALE